MSHQQPGALGGFARKDTLRGEHLDAEDAAGERHEENTRVSPKPHCLSAVEEPPKFTDDAVEPGLMSRFFLFFAAIFWSSAFEGEPGMTFEQMSTHTTLSRYHAAVWPSVSKRSPQSRLAALSSSSSARLLARSEIPMGGLDRCRSNPWSTPR